MCLFTFLLSGENFGDKTSEILTSLKLSGTFKVKFEIENPFMQRLFGYILKGLLRSLYQPT